MHLVLAERPFPCRHCDEIIVVIYSCVPPLISESSEATAKPVQFVFYLFIVLCKSHDPRLSMYAQRLAAALTCRPNVRQDSFSEFT